ncbi:MAG: FecR domain-containing protein [Planctomycetes bacterium]|nr:FecR domain-containing protein [Planctomycetota bacterium]
MINRNSMPQPRDSFPSQPEADLPEEEVLLAAELTAALDQPGVSAEKHLSYPELESSVEARGREGEAWEMPAHLMDCPLCLEIFEILLNPGEKASPLLSERCHRLLNAVPSRRKPVFIHGQRWILAAAALILLCLGGALYLMTRQITIQVEAGQFQNAQGLACARNPAVDPGSVLQTTESARAVLKDGSAIPLAPATRLSFHAPLLGGTGIRLLEGKLEAEVNKQQGLDTFRIDTPLGSVQVVGTRFSVSFRSEEVTIYKSENSLNSVEHSKMEIMRVEVSEGVVRVSNRSETLRLGAGWRAELRQGQTHIEVEPIGRASAETEREPVLSGVKTK